MRIRRIVLVLMAALVLSAAGATAAFAAPRAQEHGVDAAQARLGLDLTPLTTAATEELGLPEGLVGLLVQGVAADSPAAAAGMQIHDVINGVEGSGAVLPADVLKALAQAEPGSVLALTVVRNGARLEVAIQVPDGQNRPDRPEQSNGSAQANRPAQASGSARPNQQVPAWLRQAYQFANQHPRALDNVFRNVDEDGSVHVLAATNGTLIAMGVVLSDGTDGAIDATTDVAGATRFIVVQMLNGETKRFRLNADTVFIEALQRTTLAELDLGERVIVVERDGSVVGVVAGPYQRDGRPAPKPQPRPNPGNGNNNNEGIKQALEQISKRFERIEHGMQNLNERMTKMGERFAQHNHGNVDIEDDDDDQEGDAA